MTGEKQTSPALYRMICALAAVACAFSLLVGILLIANSMAVSMASPLNLPELDHLRATLKASPADEAVRDKIRDLDQVVRHLYFTGLASGRTGVALLLAGITIALASLKFLAVLRRRQPDLRGIPPASDPLHEQSVTRWALAGVGILILAIIVSVGQVGRDLRARAVPDRQLPGIDAAGSAAPTSSVPVECWPAFRGVSGGGVATSKNPPMAWDVATGSGVLWKADVPLSGMSSPVVWGNKVYLTGASEGKREVYCYDLMSGTRLWLAEVKGVPGQIRKVPEIFQDTGYAAPTSVTDGLRVYSIFANGDVIALDSCSTVMWTLDLGLPANRYGHSASLAFDQGRVLVQFDQDAKKGKPSRLLALDSATGKTVWSTPRPVSDSWPSPVVIETGRGRQLVTVANDWIIAYDPASGRELWKVKCKGTDVASSPVFAGGLILASITADRIYAIRPDGAGDVTATHVAWTTKDGVSDVSSPASNGELAFFVNSSGLMICLEVKTGAKVWEQSLEGEFYGSPTLAGDKLYLVARDGTVLILRVGREYGEIAKMSLGEPSDGSPVFVGDRLLIRGIKTLFCIGNKAK